MRPLSEVSAELSSPVFQVDVLLQVTFWEHGEVKRFRLAATFGDRCSLKTALNKKLLR